MALRRETPIQYPCCSRERLWAVEDLKGRYRNGQNEWMNEFSDIFRVEATLLGLVKETKVTITVVTGMRPSWGWQKYSRSLESSQSTESFHYKRQIKQTIRYFLIQLNTIKFNHIQCWAWWLTGRVDSYRPEGSRFESRSSCHVRTLGKSFTCSCLCASAWNSDTVSVL